MSIDLERSLHDLARSVHDDDLATRMSGQVHHMVVRIRRRRAARHAATGVVGVGAATAVVVGGLQLAGGGRSGTAQVVWSADAWGCAEAPDVPAVADGGVPAALLVDHPVAAATGSSLDVHVTVGTELPAPDDPAGQVIGLTEAPVALLVRDDVVVAQGQVVTTAESFPPQHTVALALDGCLAPHDALPTGSYTLVVRQVADLGAGPVTLESRTALEVTATEAEARALQAAVPTSAPTAAPSPAPTEPQSGAGGTGTGTGRVATQADLEALLAQAPQGTFPACASAVTSQAEPPLSLDLVLEDRPYAPGEAVTGTVGLRANGGRTVLANAPSHGALLVLTQAGAVVGREYRDTEDVTLLEATGEPVPVDLTGSMTLCGVPASETGAGGLPPGRYDAYAVMEVMLKEIQGPGGTAEATSESMVVMSAPVAVTIE
ncbi:hypothetical protein [Actinotalea solisilvae]|uniref:hypothetical protein n=1 Tax=Actinotalea solisilvae TaxID=2072922 RepID=UPI0018F25C43|nr:hypothetical protein [Actinotalea solisilvae]